MGGSGQAQVGVGVKENKINSMSFRTLLIKEFFGSLKNDYTDNYTADWGFSITNEEYSPYKIAPFGKFKDYLRFLERTYNFIGRNSKYFVGKYHRGFKYLYDILVGQESKDLLIKVLTYRMLGHRKVKLSLNNPWYWQKMNEVEKYFSKEDMVKVNNINLELKRINLEEIGYPINMYYTSLGILTDFVIKPYEYKNIKAGKGDVVIDAGACYGDTALFFANEVGDNGKVFSFEFVPTNLKILYKNIELNPNLKHRIEVIENPLWSESKKTMYYTDNGESSGVSFKDNKNHEGKVATITIDDFVKQKSITKINFIKIDIEGAELEALKGAAGTIKKFKPKIAVCIYHRLDDFISIPHFLNDLDVGYKFHLKHSSIHAGETVLFASTDQ